MLDGRYPSERFAELRPRIVWDRTAGTVRGRKGARQLAVTNAGTIPDRGLYGVHLPDGRRVGELDEEMVYEARAGQIFLLGASTLADRGDHPRPRHRHARRPGVPGAVPVLARRGRRPPRRARPGDRRVLPRGGRRGARAAGRGVRPRPPRRRRTSSPTCASSRRRPASFPPTRRSSSSASATRSATGASASSRRSAAASTPPGAWRSRRGSATSSTSRPTRSGPTTGSSSTSPTPTRRPSADLVLLERRRGRGPRRRASSRGSALFGARFRENAAPLAC